MQDVATAGRFGRARELAALALGWRGTTGSDERARFSTQPGGPALRPRTAPSARRARASLLLPRRAPRLSFYSLLPAPSLRGGARRSRHSPALPTPHPGAAPTPPLPCPPTPLAKSRLPTSRRPPMDGHAPWAPLRPMSRQSREAGGGVKRDLGMGLEEGCRGWGSWTAGPERGRGAEQVAARRGTAARRSRGLGRGGQSTEKAASE